MPDRPNESRPEPAVPHTPPGPHVPEYAKPASTSPSSNPQAPAKPTKSPFPLYPWWDNIFVGALTVLAGCGIAFMLSAMLIFTRYMSFSPFIWFLLTWLPPLAFWLAKSKRALPASLIFATLSLLVTGYCGALVLSS